MTAGAIFIVISKQEKLRFANMPCSSRPPYLRRI